jgi:hypothetical protein
MKKVKAPMNVHTPKSQMGMGDHYGSGIRQKVGRMREDFMTTTPATPKRLNKPPKSVV